jgi:lysophospholipase L1-like esterase
MAVTRIKRVLKVLLLPIVLILGIELLLQLGALIVAATGRDIPTGWSTKNTHVLALGDSNTFGIYLEEEDSYPAQLEKLWNGRHPDNMIEVVNLGYPGTNSFRVADTIEEVVTAFKPDVVLLTVGVNDMFTASEFVEANAEAGSDAAAWAPLTLLRRYSRLYKLVYMTKQGINSTDLSATTTGNQSSVSGNPAVNKRDLLKWSNDKEERMQGIIEFKKANSQSTENSTDLTETISYGDKTIVMISATENSNEPGKERGYHHIQHNLSSIRQKVEQSGATFYLLTYAASGGFYAAPNSEIRNYVENHQPLRFIDVATEIKKDCPVSANCQNLFFRDLHPKQKGYEKVAEIIAATFEQDPIKLK